MIASWYGSPAFRATVWVLAAMALVGVAMVKLMSKVSPASPTRLMSVNSTTPRLAVAFTGEAFAPAVRKVVCSRLPELWATVALTVAVAKAPVFTTFPLRS